MSKSKSKVLFCLPHRARELSTTREGEKTRAQQHDMVKKYVRKISLARGHSGGKETEAGSKGISQLGEMKVLEKGGDSETGKEQVDLRTLGVSRWHVVAGYREKAKTGGLP